MVEDLSRYHHPITSLFDQPRSKSEWKSYCLSDEQIDFYRKNGYVSRIRVLNAAQVAVLLDELDGLAHPSHETNPLFYEYNSNESQDPTKVLFHALGAWRVSKSFHDLLWNPAFAVRASQLLEGRVRFWHDQLFCKPPLQGGVVAWHQD